VEPWLVHIINSESTKIDSSQNPIFLRYYTVSLCNTHPTFSDYSPVLTDYAAT